MRIALLALLSALAVSQAANVRAPSGPPGEPGAQGPPGNDAPARVGLGLQCGANGVTLQGDTFSCGASTTALLTIGSPQNVSSATLALQAGSGATALHIEGGLVADQTVDFVSGGASLLLPIRRVSSACAATACYAGCNANERFISGGCGSNVTDGHFITSCPSDGSGGPCSSSTNAVGMRCVVSTVNPVTTTAYALCLKVAP